MSKKLIVHNRVVFENHNVINGHDRNLGDHYSPQPVGERGRRIGEYEANSVLFSAQQLDVHISLILPTGNGRAGSGLLNVTRKSVLKINSEGRVLTWRIMRSFFSVQSFSS